MQDGDHVTRVLVAGAGGQLGSRLAELGSGREGIQVVCSKRSALDITDPSSIHEALELHAPDVVINAAAYTEVDLAETETELAYAINGEGVKNLAEACCNQRVALIHVSTDYVFGQVERVPLAPSEPTGPLGVYGTSKLRGEEAFLASGVKGAVVRVAWLYDARGGNFLTTMLRLANQHGRLKVVNDQHGVPTSAPALANALLDMAERRADMPQGIRHYAHAGHTTWHGFASAIVGHAGLDVPVEAVTSDAFPTAAIRPAWSVLDGRPLHEEMGWAFEPWQKALAACWKLREQG
jgi:dTDP-4-dehydrorhamnose reductase